ncbi:MAG: D-aminoacylase [Cyclobacteriaceae bacterium]
MMNRIHRIANPVFFLLLTLLIYGCGGYDVIIRNGTVYDGSGGEPFTADIGIKKDRIDSIGDLSEEKAKDEIDATGLAVAPGFVNSLSWAARSLRSDGRSMSNIKQGVTLEIFGEGSSPGPYDPEKTGRRKRNSFGENMRNLEKGGISTNVASFVGATTIRRYVLGSNDVDPGPEDLEKMKSLVRQSMLEGALGVGSSLIYPPAYFADTDELVALSEAAGEYGGMYISHMRSEGDHLEEGVRELITIAERAGVPAEIYHLKAAGRRNWYKLDEVIDLIDSARDAGLQISTNMYTYTGASTGIGACFPPWVQEGSDEDWVNRLKVDSIRTRVISEIKQQETEWENFYTAAGDPANILLLGFDQDSLRKYNGMNLAEISTLQDRDPAEMLVDLVIRENGNISAAYFLMSEENVRKKIKLPYMSFGSDARSVAAEGDVIEDSTHPRTYGNFARLLGKYVREENVIPLNEAIYKLSGLPVDKYGIPERGYIRPGYYADIVVFDPARIIDKATFNNPHQYAGGMVHVFVNGRQVLSNGEHTGKKPGVFVKGKGATQ